MKTVHRILTPVLSVLIFPVAIFLPLIRMVISSGLASGENKTNLLDNFGIGEFISLKDIYTLFIADSDSTSTSLIKSLWSALAEDKKQAILDSMALNWGIVFLVLLAAVLLVALAAAIVSAATKKPGISILLSGFGVICTLLMNTAFDAFAKPFVIGAVNLNTLLGTSNQLLGALLGNVASVDYMKLGIAYSVILLIFVCCIILGICAYMEQKNEDK